MHETCVLDIKKENEKEKEMLMWRKGGGLLKVVVMSDGRTSAKLFFYCFNLCRASSNEYC